MRENNSERFHIWTTMCSVRITSNVRGAIDHVPLEDYFRLPVYITLYELEKYKLPLKKLEISANIILLPRQNFRESWEIHPIEGV